MKSAMAAAFATLLISGTAFADEPVPEIDIVGTAPVPGAGIPREQVPANVEILGSDVLDKGEAVNNGIGKNVASANLSDTESNPWQQDLYIRGFNASPVLGTPEGIAVYQNGVRINEPFGDTVLWDLIPTFAVRQAEIVPGSSPLYGLNALGGSVGIQMKDGFSFSGNSIDVAGGSFGRARLIAESGQNFGDMATYIGFMAGHDGGWRHSDASDILQGFGDFAFRGSRGNAGISVTLAGDTLNENAAIPIQDSREAAFAVPDVARDRVFLVQGRGDYALSDAWSLRGTAFFRSTQTTATNGGFSTDYPGVTGTFPVQTSDTNGLGGSFEASNTSSLFGFNNIGAIGGDFSYAHTSFNLNTLAGFTTFQNGGTTTYSLGYPLPGAPTISLTTNRMVYGIYGRDTVSLTDSLAATVSGRFNVDSISLSDHLGEGLGGSHFFPSFDPSAGLTYNLPFGITTYANFSEATRSPTAAELSCANPINSCTFPLSFISDPGLKQVTARTLEAGARGKIRDGELTLDWSAALYGTRNENDIIFISAPSSINPLSGYFANAGTTQRLGAEASVKGRWGKWDFRASYGFVDATFRSTLLLPSQNNPAADMNGNILVRQGDRLPGIPQHLGKVGLGYEPLPKLHVGLDLTVVSSQYFRGDEANLQAPLDGYFVLDAAINYEVVDGIQLYFDGQNITNNRYSTYGLYGDPTGNGAFPRFTDPRFIVPAQPFGFWAGVKATF
jgi:iron complex outermembrane recepter protein